jgi:rubredoxin
MRGRSRIIDPGRARAPIAAFGAAPAVGQWQAHRFPRCVNRRMAEDTATTVAYRTWMCVVCGFVYDEAAGLPEEGIAPGTRWEDVPETWTCPDCGVTKDDFEMMPL